MFIFTEIQLAIQHDTGAYDNVVDGSRALTLEGKSKYLVAWLKIIPIDKSLSTKTWREAHVSKRVLCIEAKVIIKVAKPSERAHDDHLNDCKDRKDAEAFYELGLQEKVIFDANSIL